MSKEGLQGTIIATQLLDAMEKDGHCFRGRPAFGQEASKVILELARYITELEESKDVRAT